MKKKNLIKCVTRVALLGLLLSVSPVGMMSVKASELSDLEVNSNEEVGVQEEAEQPSGNSNGGEATADNGVSDMLKDYNAMSPEQLREASNKISPLTNMVGYGMGVLISVITTCIFLLTCLDLLYIAVPPMRGLLFQGNTSGNVNQGMGGFGMGGMSSNAQADNRSGAGLQLISDEALQCSVLFGNGGQAQQSIGMMGQSQMGTPQVSKKSVIATYFKKRAVFMVLFAICASILTTSLFLGTGVNLAQWFTKLIETFNGYIPS